MSIVLEALSVPLQMAGDGCIRVAGSRVTLDTIVAAFDQGETPESIVDQYPGLLLDDVYAVVAYYLRNREEVAAYLRDRAEGRGGSAGSGSPPFPKWAARTALGAAGREAAVTMLRFLADQNFDNRIVRGLLRRARELLDLVRVQRRWVVGGRRSARAGMGGGGRAAAADSRR